MALALAWLFRFPGRKLSKVHPMRASTFQPELVPKRVDTIVIGSGSGGCACANLLAQSGQKVLLLEQHYRTGGCKSSRLCCYNARTFRLGQFHGMVFDTTN